MCACPKCCLCLFCLCTVHWSHLRVQCKWEKHHPTPHVLRRLGPWETCHESAKDFRRRRQGGRILRMGQKWVRTHTHTHTHAHTHTRARAQASTTPLQRTDSGTYVDKAKQCEIHFTVLSMGTQGRLSLVAIKVIEPWLQVLFHVSSSAIAKLSVIRWISC